MDIISSIIILLLVMDPFGNLPMLGSVLANYDAKEQRRILIRENLIALALLLLFLFCGAPLLNFLQLDTSTLSITGGFVLVVIAFGMLFPSKAVLSGPNDSSDEEPFFVPIATPLIAGPSALTYVMLMAKQHNDQLLEASIATLSAWLISGILLLSSPFLLNKLGKKGLRALERLMGMILILISTQMILDGIASYYAKLMTTT